MGKYLMLIDDPQERLDGPTPRDTALVLLGHIEDGEGDDCGISVQVFNRNQIGLLADGVALLDDPEAEPLEAILKHIPAHR